MSYQSAIDHLAAMAPELATQTGQARRKFSLSEIAILLNAFGNPQRTFPSVLIAGTNGKGSTAATLAAILTASGLRTGLWRQCSRRGLSRVSCQRVTPGSRWHALRLAPYVKIALDVAGLT